MADLTDENTSTNVTASELLDADHKVIGVSEFDDDIDDTCATCRFAVGWYSKNGSERWGHATQFDSAVIRSWITENTSTKEDG